VRTEPVSGGTTARRIGALALACLGGVLATLSLANPAYAEHADLRLEIRSGGIALTAGGDRQTLNLAVTNDGPSPVSAAVANVEAPLSGRGVTIGNTSVSCSPVNGPSIIACQLGAMNPGQTIDVTIELVPPGSGTVQPGENVTENGNAWVSNPAGGDPNNGNDGGSFSAALSAGDTGAPVTEVSGSVMDGSSGNPLDGATVEIKDSDGTVGTATTDAGGRFTYRAEAPLKAGRISIKASKDGYDTSRTTVNASGSVNDIQLAVSPAAASSPSSSPTAAPTTAAPQSPPPGAASATGDGSSVSLIVVVLISVLATAVLTGAGLWIGLRRNRENDSATAGGPGPPPVRPHLGDAPTVQLRLDGLGGGTQVMPPLRQPLSSSAVDATQQIPQPDSTQLMPPGAGPYLPPPPAVEYDETAPFGPGPAAHGFGAGSGSPYGAGPAAPYGAESYGAEAYGAEAAAPYGAEPFGMASPPPPGLYAPLPNASPTVPAAPPYGVPPAADIPPPVSPAAPYGAVPPANGSARPFGVPPMPDAPTQVSPASPFGVPAANGGQPGGATPPFGVPPVRDLPTQVSPASPFGAVPPVNGNRPPSAAPPFGAPPQFTAGPPFEAAPPLSPGAPGEYRRPAEYAGPFSSPVPASPPPPPSPAAPPGSPAGSPPPVDYRGPFAPAPPAVPGAPAGSAPDNGRRTRPSSAVDFARPSRAGAPTGFSSPLDTTSPADPPPQPTISPLTTHSGALPPITALQAPVPSRAPAPPTRPAVNAESEDAVAGRHSGGEPAPNPDAPHRGRHSASPS